MKTFLLTKLSEQMQDIHGNTIAGKDATYTYVWMNVLGACGGQVFSGKDKVDAIGLAMRIGAADELEISESEKELVTKVLDNSTLNAATYTFLQQSIVEKVEEPEQPE